MLVTRRKNRENNHTEENVLGCTGGTVTTVESPVQGMAMRWPREVSSSLEVHYSTASRALCSWPTALQHLPAPELTQHEQNTTVFFSSAQNQLQCDISLLPKEKIKRIFWCMWFYIPVQAAVPVRL